MNSTPQMLKPSGPYTSPWANAMYKLGWRFSWHFGWRKFADSGGIIALSDSKTWKEDNELVDSKMEAGYNGI